MTSVFKEVSLKSFRAPSNFNKVNLELFLQILTGHQDNAEFALAMCPTEPYVLSGGGEFSILMYCC